MTTIFEVWINHKKHNRYHGYTAEGICRLGQQIANDMPNADIFIVDDENNIYFEHESTNPDEAKP